MKLRFGIKKKEAEPDSGSTTTRASRNICISYTALVISLLVTMPLLAYFSYSTLSQNERQTFTTLYDALGEDIFREIDKSTARIFNGAQALASYVGIAAPDAESWPNASIAFYGEMNDDIGAISDVKFALSPIVYPEEAPGFEAFSREVLSNTPGVPDGAGTSPFGYGIFAFGPNGQRYHDTTGVTAHSPYVYMTPLLYSAFPETTLAFLYNTHSNSVRAKALDASFECALTNGSMGSCAVTTDIIQHISDPKYRPNTLLVHPIFPVSNRSKITGFLIGGFNWDTIFENSVSEVVQDIECVVNSPTTAYTIKISSGKTILVGSGDRHNDKFNEYRKSRDVEAPSDAVGSTRYSIDIYPTQVFYDEYHTDMPIYWTVAGVLVIFVISLLFILYDRFMQADNDEKAQVLAQKRMFVRLVSHEIRTPLNTVKMGLRLQEEVLSSPDKLKLCKVCAEVKELTADIQASTDVALSVLNDLLQYDKIEMGRLSIEVNVVSMWKVIRDVVHSFKLDATNRDVNLELKSEVDGPHLTETRRAALNQLYVMGDQIRLAQTVRNLVSNALKFSPAGTTVTVSARWEEHGLPTAPVLEPKMKDLCVNIVGEHPQRMGSLILAVQDEGPGISKENQQKLFGEGQQFDANKLQGGQGSGLGLFISKGIVELHNGKIWAVSDQVESDRGTTFWVELPLVRGTPMSPGVEDWSSSICSSTETKSASCEGPNTLEMVGRRPSTVQESAKLKILVVDDSASNRKLLCRLLDRRGYEYGTAENGKECLDIIFSPGGHNYDCIILDNHMPVMTGPEAAREIKGARLDIPIFGLTGSVMKDDLSDFMSSGVIHVFEKPLNMNEFDRILLQHEALIMTAGKGNVQSL